ncbi:alpha-amylase, partial [candidate division KSB1 bacterium]|nr:alpha-amylase [candidate division KSB1 bacterium]
MIKTRLLLVCSLATASWGQILTWTPLFPTAEDTITIIYDATQGTAGLVGVADVYAHTGVITNLSDSPSAWRYVKTSWGVNTPDTRMESVGNDKWRIRFHIRSYYGVPESETIRELAFVFRSADSKKEGKDVGGKDIFLPIYQQGMNITLLAPSPIPVFAEPGDTVAIRAAGSQADSLFLYIDEERLACTDHDTLAFDLIVATPGKHVVRIVARDAGGGEKSLRFYIASIGPQLVQERPPELQDGLTRLGTNRFGFSLLAPYKKFVYLIGDFNDWEAEPEQQMILTPDSLRYWVIAETPSESILRYQYLVDGLLTIADPYSELVLDPFHDSQIPEEIFTNLPPYPAGKTVGIVSAFAPQLQKYAWQNKDWQKPDPAELVIYELLVRDFLSSPSFRTLTDTLGYLSRLGVNAIELMPLNEFEGNDSWGYNPSFYLAPDKYYGRGEDLKHLIDTAHAHGIAVIQDIVLNHAYGQCPLVQLYVDDMARNPWFNARSPNPVFSWGYDFNHTSRHTRDFVDRVLEHWLTEYRIDGFRLDFSKGMTNTPGDGYAYDPARIAILKRIADRVWAADSTAYVILEHFCENREERELADYGMLVWGNMNYAYNEATMGYHDNSKSDFSGVSYQTRNWSKPALVGYMESHDEERLMVKNLLYGNSSGDYNIKELETALARQKLAAAFFFTIPGPKMIWQFGEMGYDYSINTNGRLGRKPIRWDYLQDDHRKALFETYAALIKLRRTQSTFQTSDFYLSAASPVKRLALTHSEMNAVVLGNFDVIPAYINANFQHSGAWYDYFSGDTLQADFSQTVILLNPGEFRIYTDVKLEAPEMTTGIAPEIQSGVRDFVLYPAYPNPF